MALQEIGLKAVMDIGGFARNVRQYERMLKDMDKRTADTAKSMTQSGQQMAEAFKDLSKIELSEAQVERINELAAAGMTVEEAYKKVTAESKETEAATTSLALSSSQLAMIFGAVSTAVTVLVKFMRDAIAQFREAGMETYKLSLVLGTTAEEASALSAISQLLDVSTTSLEVTFGMFAKRLFDMKTGLAEGVEESTTFTRALERLNVPMYDAAGNVRDVNELLPEIATRFQEMGPGLETTGLAMDLFGRSARDLLPILMEGGEAIKEMEARASYLGAVMSEEDVVAARDLTKATGELTLAKQGLQNVIARELIPVLEYEARVWADIIAAGRLAIATTNSLTVGIVTYLRTLDLTAARETAAAEGAYYLTGARADEAAATGEVAEGLLLLTGAYEAARQKQQELYEKLTTIARQFSERMAEININLSRQIEDMGIARARRLVDIAIAEARRVIDAARDAARRREDMQRDYTYRLQDIERERIEKLEAVRQQHRQREIDLEERYQERLRDIQFRFADAADEALRTRDAVALLRAMRDRARGIRDAERDRDKEQRTEDKNYQEQLQAAREANEERIRQAQEAYRRQEEQLRISLQRQAEDRIISLRRQLQDMNIAQGRQREDLARNYQRQQEDLQRHLLQQEGLWGAHLGRLQGMLASFVATMTWAGAQTASLWRFQQAFANLGQMGLPVPAFGMQKGGAGTVTKPTLFMAGERGPERFAFAPVGVGGTVRFDVRVQHSGEVGGGSWIGPTLDQFDAAVNTKLVRLAKVLRGG